MNRKQTILSFLVLFGSFLFFLNYLSITDAQTANNTLSNIEIEQKKTEFLSRICAEHGGVNCSIINKDASIVCNDGTIDNYFLTIYGVPQCQETINALTKDQSDFMAESGCFPPSELRCIDEGSYQKLSNQLLKSGLIYTELGKGELAECRKQIGGYKKDADKYKQCLAVNGKPNFEPSGKVILPVLKAVFCPIFYGNKASYDSETELCRCDSGYFMNDEQCVQASQICQAKYGPWASAKNGNCVVASVTSTFVRSITSAKTPEPRSYPTQTPDALQTINYRPQTSALPATILPSPEEISENQLPKPEVNFVQNIISSIISGLKKMLRLF